MFCECIIRLCVIWITGPNDAMLIKVQMCIKSKGQVFKCVRIIGKMKKLGGLF